MHGRGAYFHVFKTSDQMGHTSMEPQKLRWPRAPSLPKSVPGCDYFEQGLYCLRLTEMTMSDLLL